MAAEEPRKLTRSEQKAMRQQAKDTLAAAAAEPQEQGDGGAQLTRRERKQLAKQQKEAAALLAAPPAPAKPSVEAAAESTEKLTRAQKRALKEAARAKAAPKHVTFAEKEQPVGSNPLDRPPNPNGVGGMFGKQFSPLGVNSQGHVSLSLCLSVALGLWRSASLPLCHSVSVYLCISVSLPCRRSVSDSVSLQLANCLVWQAAYQEAPQENSLQAEESAQGHPQ